MYCIGTADANSFCKVLLESYNSEWSPPLLSEQDMKCRKIMQLYISKYRPNKSEFHATGSNTELKTTVLELRNRLLNDYVVHVGEAISAENARKYHTAVNVVRSQERKQLVSLLQSTAHFLTLSTPHTLIMTCTVKKWVWGLKQALGNAQLVQYINHTCTDNTGDTALGMAIKFSSLSIVNMLMCAGASPTIRNKLGQCAGEISILSGAKNTVYIVYKAIFEECGDPHTITSAIYFANSIKSEPELLKSLFSVLPLEKRTEIKWHELICSLHGQNSDGDIERLNVILDSIPPNVLNILHLKYAIHSKDGNIAVQIYQRLSKCVQDSVEACDIIEMMNMEQVSSNSIRYLVPEMLKNFNRVNLTVLVNTLRLRGKSHIIDHVLCHILPQKINTLPISLRASEVMEPQNQMCLVVMAFYHNGEHKTENPMGFGECFWSEEAWALYHKLTQIYADGYERTSGFLLTYVGVLDLCGIICLYLFEGVFASMDQLLIGK